KGFELPEIEAAGLVNRRGLDSFFGRATFPLVEDGSVVILDHSKVNETVRNEICNVLGRADDPGVAGKLVAHLDKMLRDKGHSLLWRDYCTQHLRECYVRRGLTEVLEGLRWAASKSDEPKVRSAGLYSLGLLAREMKWTGDDNDNDPAARAGEAPTVLEEIETQFHAALDPGQHVDVRTNAVRAACVADRRDFIPAIRKLLADDKEPLQLRNACASVLGQFRDPGSVPALETAAKSGPSRLTRTAERSLRNIRKQPHGATRDAKVEETPPAAKTQDVGKAPHF
ncbi:MAG: HEAT repeat domain-containing protein, partial [Planctomycetota bacterium]